MSFSVKEQRAALKKQQEDKELEEKMRRDMELQRMQQKVKE